MVEHPSPDILRQYVQGELAPHVKVAVQSHVQQCPDVCQPQIGELLETTAGCEPGDAPEVVGSSELAGVPCPPQYRLLGKLGSGGMAVVYRAIHTELKRIVAIKMIKPGLDRSDPNWLARFRLEGEAMARLSHPHIATIYEVGQVDDHPFLVLEYAPGGCLEDRLRQFPLTDPRTMAKTVELIARGMHYAHEHGLIHRDLKPSNLLLAAPATVNGDTQTESGVIRVGEQAWIPKIADFGLVKFVHESLDLSLPGERLGSPSYMAPEQAQGHLSEVGTRTDVHALGLILYRLMTGQTPFTGTSRDEVCDKVKHLEPPSPRITRSHLPSDLETICLKCLRKAPVDRYPSAAALADDLGCFLRGEPIAARPVGPVERVVKWARRRPAIAALSVLGAVSVLLLVGVIVASRYNAELARINRQIDGANEQLSLTNQALDQSNQRLNVALTETERQRNAALSARREADRLKQLAEEQRSERYRYQYLSSIALVGQLWREGRHFEIAPLLDKITPPPGEVDPRGFEWHYWKKVASDLRHIPAHAEVIFSLAVAPQGTLAATGSQDRTIRLWRTATGEADRTLEGHTLPVTGLAFSPDGERLASVASDPEKPNLGGEFRLWNVATGETVAAKTIPLVPLSAVAYHPRGERIVTGGAMMSLFGRAGVLHVWDAATGRQERTLTGQSLAQQLVSSLAFSPDGRQLAVATFPNPRDPGTLQLWDAADWKFVRRIGQHKGGLWSVAFTPDGEQLVTSGIGTVVHVWDVSGGAARHALEGHEHMVARIAVNAEGTRLATGGFDGVVCLWDLPKGKLLTSLKGHSGFVYGLGFSPDGQKLVSAGADGAIRIWDVTLGRQHDLPLPARGGEFARAQFGPDGKQLVWTSGGKSGGGEFGVWNVETRETTFSKRDPQTAFAGLAVHPQGTVFAVGTGRAGRKSGDVQLWSLASHEREKSFDLRGGLINGLAFTPDGRWLLAIDQAGGLLRIDVASGERHTFPKVHRHPIQTLAVSPDGRQAATGAFTFQRPGGELKLWDIANVVELPKLNTSDRGVMAVEFSPDGRHLAVLSVEERLHIWDLAMRSVALDLPVARMGTTIAYNHNGTRIAAGCIDGTVSLWDSRTGFPVLSVNIDGEPINSLAFSPDDRGLLIATGTPGGKGHIRLWNAGP